MPGARRLASSLLKPFFMKDLKYFITCLEESNIPYLYPLLKELADKGVILSELSPSLPRDEWGRVPAESFLISDNNAGAEFARLNNIGYAVYEPEGRKSLELFQDAQCVFQGFDEVRADFVEKLYQRHEGIPWTILETERTVVRELSLSDIDDLFELYEDKEIKRYIPPLLPREEEAEFQKAYIEKMYGFFGYGYWLVFSKADGALIGRAGLSHRAGFDELELGYLFSGKYRKKGIATEVCRGILEYARDILGQESLMSCIREDNKASIAFIEKMGFKQIDSFESENRNMLRFTVKL